MGTNLASTKIDFTSSNSKREEARVRKAEGWGKGEPLARDHSAKRCQSQERRPELLGSSVTPQLHQQGRRKRWWGRALTLAEGQLRRHFIHSSANFCP